MSRSRDGARDQRRLFRVTAQWKIGGAAVRSWLLWAQRLTVAQAHGFLSFALGLRTAGYFLLLVLAVRDPLKTAHKTVLVKVSKHRWHVQCI